MPAPEFVWDLGVIIANDMKFSIHIDKMAPKLTECVALCLQVLCVVIMYF